MRFRSTGLGERELRGDLADLSPVGQNLLVLHIQTNDPVKWHLRVGLEPSDIPKLLKAFLKPSVLLLIIQSIFYMKKNPKEPEDIMSNLI